MKRTETRPVYVGSVRLGGQDHVVVQGLEALVRLRQSESLKYWI